MSSSYEQFNEKMIDLIETIEGVEEELERREIVIEQRELGEISNNISNLKDLLYRVEETLMFYSNSDSEDEEEIDNVVAW